MKIPKIVQGNSFAALVRVVRHAYSDGKGIIEELNLHECTDISVSASSMRGSAGVTWELSGKYDNGILIRFSGDEPCGSYSLEITGKTDGRACRFYAKPSEFLSIVNATSDGFIPDDTDSEYFSTEVQVGVAGIVADVESENGNVYLNLK